MSDEKDTPRDMAFMVICDYSEHLRANLKQNWTISLDKTSPVSEEVYALLRRGEGALQRARAIAFAQPLRTFVEYGSVAKLTELVELMEGAIRAYDRG
jgi:hypothetical protein